MRTKHTNPVTGKIHHIGGFSVIWAIMFGALYFYYKVWGVKRILMNFVPFYWAFTSTRQIREHFDDNGWTKEKVE